mmetsp:Transcript_12933/g.20481  ORF Transcript_12933/g.20481 Transcript_12933/m.20481 type:complete len:279 (+) Transcript_12933:362-1198(+)
MSCIMALERSADWLRGKMSNLVREVYTMMERPKLLILKVPSITSSMPAMSAAFRVMRGSNQPASLTSAAASATAAGTASATAAAASCAQTGLLMVKAATAAAATAATAHSVFRLRLVWLSISTWASARGGATNRSAVRTRAAAMHRCRRRASGSIDAASTQPSAFQLPVEGIADVPAASAGLTDESCCDPRTDGPPATEEAPCAFGRTAPCDKNPAGSVEHLTRSKAAPAIAGTSIALLLEGLAMATSLAGACARATPAPAEQAARGNVSGPREITVA